MRKKHFKSFLSLLVAMCLLVSSTVVCFAAEPINPDSEKAYPLEITLDGDNHAKSGVIHGPLSGTTSGYISGSFTVPQVYNGHLIRVHFCARPKNGANASAVFQIYITGNNVSKIIYMPATNNMTPYSIGYLNAGTYRYSISPQSNVSGQYLYGLQFYAY